MGRILSLGRIQVRVCFSYKHLIQIQSCTNTTKDVKGAEDWVVSVCSYPWCTLRLTLCKSNTWTKHPGPWEYVPRVPIPCLRSGFTPLRISSLPVEFLPLLRDPEAFSMIPVMFFYCLLDISSWMEGRRRECWYHFFPHLWAPRGSSTVPGTEKMHPQ